MRISQIITYPIKSLGGFQQTTAVVTPQGLQFDRRWMLVTPEGKFLTQRTFPRMALFKTALSGDYLKVTAPNQLDSFIEIPLEAPKEQPAKMVEVWASDVMALQVNPEFDTWFSRHLGTECQLVYMPEESKRPIKAKYNIPNGVVSFADSNPILIIGEASLNDLNNRLESPVEMNRFRPNLVVEGSVPYGEEEWQQVSVGPVHFRVAKACTRCKMITINQSTAAVGQEPLKTLATYKAKNNQIDFGVLVAWANEEWSGGTPMISLGDEVVV
ncbi:MAG: MOSC N-terminal beta barrel domain-containing protein [Bacteroidota bacterium]